MGFSRYPEVTQLTLDAVGPDILEGMQHTDKETLAHSLATGAMTMEAMQWAGCSEETVAIGAVAGTLHDAGKFHPVIQALISETRGKKFTSSQAELMRTHTTRGFLSIAHHQRLDALSTSPVVAAAAFTALRHHSVITEIDYSTSAFTGICHTVQVCDVAHARLFDAARTYRMARDGIAYTPQQIGQQIVRQFADLPPMPDGHTVPIVPLVDVWVEEVTRRQDLGTLD